MAQQITMPLEGRNGECEGAFPPRITHETDLLIIGAGPAGASLACFLAQHGMLARAHCSFAVANWRKG
jgi:NADPH-dependent 2,4-dienoyl-CoA reductase/sulfur reductase-like enzyme